MASEYIVGLRKSLREDGSDFSNWTVAADCIDCSDRELVRVSYFDVC